MRSLKGSTTTLLGCFPGGTRNPTQPDDPSVVADGGNYSDVMVAGMLKTVNDNVLNQICMVFLINVLPPNLQSKVLEKKSTTMKEFTMEAAEYQRFLVNKTQPAGSPQKPRVLTIDEGVKSMSS